MNQQLPNSGGRLTDRAALLQYILEHKERAGVLAGLTEEEIHEWAADRDTEFLQAVAGGLWKDELGAAGLSR